MLSFLNEEYGKVCGSILECCSSTSSTLSQSEQELTLAFYNCHIEAHSNQEYVYDEVYVIIELNLVALTDEY